MNEEKPKTALQKRGEEFMLMVGSCVTEWAAIDSELFHICWECIGCSKERAAIVYFRTPTIEARRTLTNDLLLTVLPKKVRPNGGKDHPDVIKWSEIMKELGNLLSVRNRIAHQPVSHKIEYAQAGTMRVDEPLWVSWFELHISEHERSKVRQAGENRPLKLSDLEDHLMAIGKLSSEIFQFRLEVLSKYLKA
ncbi:MAG: hypothetical protein AAB403_12940 [Planctomycetota bacterium]